MEAFELYMEKKVVLITSTEVDNMARFGEVMSSVIELRKTAPTPQNEASSRSHLFTEFKFRMIDERGTAAGSAVFVDLAGTEKFFGSRESVVINSGLSELKLMFQEISLRGKVITMTKSLLATAVKQIVARGVKMVVISTISQKMSDCAASRSTLDFAKTASTCRLGRIKQNLLQ